LRSSSSLYSIWAWHQVRFLKTGALSTQLWKFPFAGSAEDRFDELKEYFMDTRESIHATVEDWTATLNKWTMEYPPLLMLRLAAGAASPFVFIGIWNGWS